MVRTRLLTDRERRVLEAYLNFKPYNDRDGYILYVTLHRIRKLKNRRPRAHKEDKRAVILPEWLKQKSNYKSPSDRKAQLPILEPRAGTYISGPNPFHVYGLFRFCCYFVSI
ncbi:MAG: hypothetical protein DRJ69_01000 [Thermoprotei archaeon]|nr:MAG: hypothetical protein DRJ69_01000 [Thermoprotei archaeon]